MNDIVVIGAGPYGLSVASNLRLRGLQVQVIGRTMGYWKDNMPVGMLLKSDGFATNFGAMPLSLARFCERTHRHYAPVGFRMPVADVIAYGEAFRDEYVGPVLDDRVVGVSARPDGFIVRLVSGDDVLARRVVVATGLTGFENVPAIPGMPVDRITHSSQHHALSEFAGKRVLVIGGGQSAFETAALLNENHAEVAVLSREQPRWFSAEGEAVPSAWTRFRHPNFGLGPGWRTWLWSEGHQIFYYLPEKVRLKNAYATFGPAGSGWLRDRVLGIIPVDIGTVQSAIATSSGVTLQIGDRSLHVDHVIAATGFIPDIRKIPFLQSLLADIECAAPGIPVLARDYQTSIPGLHVVGALSAASWGPSMRFIYGTNFAGPQIARSIGRDSDRRTVKIGTYSDALRSADLAT